MNRSFSWRWLLGSFMLGIGLMLGVQERYEVVSMKPGGAIKVDSWTGGSWQMRGNEWVPMSNTKELLSDKEKLAAVDTVVQALKEVDSVIRPKCTLKEKMLMVVPSDQWTQREQRLVLDMVQHSIDMLDEARGVPVTTAQTAR